MENICKLGQRMDIVDSRYLTSQQKLLLVTIFSVFIYLDLKQFPLLIYNSYELHIS